MKRLLPGIVLLSVGCPADSSPAPEPEPTARTPLRKGGPDAAPTKKPAMPSEARRDSPPEDMDALAIAARSPEMKDLPSTEGAWSRPQAPTIVAFYRGHW